MTVPSRSTLPLVLHLDHTVEPGGAELALLRLVRECRSWVPIVATPKVSGPSVFDGVERYERLGPAQYSGASHSSIVGAIGFASRALTAGWVIRRSEAFRGADVIHSNTARSAVIGALACLSSGKPHVVHLRDMVDADGMGAIGTAAMRHLVLPRALGVIASSRACLASAIPHLRRDAVVAVIPSPSNLERADPVTIRPVVRQIGMVARLAEWKGQLLLIRAFAKAFPEGDVKLRLAGGALFGDSSYEEMLRDTVDDMGIEDRVIFEGHIEAIPAFLAEIDIAVHSSLRPEPLGQNVLQYLAAGKATIVSGEGGPLEWVHDGENGLVFLPRNEDDLAAKLQLLAADTALRLRLSQAAARTEGLMTNEETRVAHGSVFSTVLQNSRLSRRGTP